jgi:hypothetical protein
MKTEENKLRIKKDIEAKVADANEKIDSYCDRYNEFY